MEKVQFGLEALGGRKPLLDVISSAILSLITIFYIYTAASFSNVPVNLLQARITYEFLFASYVFEMQVDHAIIVGISLAWLAISLREKRLKLLLIASYATSALLASLFTSTGSLGILALLSGPLITGLLIYNWLLSRQPEKRYSQVVSFSHTLYLTYLSVIAIYLGIVSLILTSDALIPNYLHNEYLRNHLYQIYLVLSSLSPILLALLLFAVPLKLICNKMVGQFRSWTQSKTDKTTRADDDGGNSRDDFEDANVDDRSSPHVSKPEQYRVAICLILIMAFSSALTFVPQYGTTGDISSDGLEGVDSGLYVRWTKFLISISQDSSRLLGQVFNEAINGDRPFSLLFLLYIAKFAQLFGGDPTIIRNIPMILAPSLVLAIYFMTKEMTSSVRVSLFAALLTTMSFQILIGIYAGFYANWLALIVGYSSIAILFRYLRNPSRVNLAFFTASLVTLLFTHAYTWIMFAFVIATFLLIQIRSNYYERRRLRILLLFFCLVVALDIIRYSLIGWVGEDAGLQTGEFSIQYDYLVERWNMLIGTTQQFLGGLFGNSIIYLLGLYWLLKCRYADPSNTLILIFMSMGIIPLVIGDWIFQSRIIYNIPFQVPAAIGMTYLLNKDVGAYRSERLIRADGRLLIIAVFLWSFTISLRMLFNFYHI